MNLTACPPSNALEAKIAAGVALVTTTFIDALGRFAKRWEELDHIDVVFEDGTNMSLTKAEWSALPLATRELIQTTQSGTVPNPTASNA